MSDVTHLRTSLGGATLIGFWASIPSPLTIEVTAAAGPDYVVVDQQHNAVGPAELLALLQAIQAGGAPSLVRVAANDAFVIGNALDLGAHGVIVPMVEDAEQAARAVSACRYAPEGVRSFGALRGPGPAPAPVCLVMIETRAGLGASTRSPARRGSTASTSGRRTSRCPSGCSRRRRSSTHRCSTRSSACATPARRRACSAACTA